VTWRNLERTIEPGLFSQTIEPKDARYNELIVEVANPQAAVGLVKAALPRQRP